VPHFVRAHDVRATTTLTISAGLACLLGGCTSLDSYLDPTIVGRWEITPADVPVLTYISSIEDRPQDLIEFSKVVSEDLLPNPADYRIGPGDRLQIRIYDIISQGEFVTYERTVDIRGLIDIPQLGRFYVNGRNVPQIKSAIFERAKVLTAEPLIELDITETRQQTFSIVGGADRPGTYIVPGPDYRLLSALTNAGRIDAPAKYIYVIRVVPLDAALDEPSGAPPSDVIVPGETDGAPLTPAADPNNGGNDILKEIESISGEKKSGDVPSPALIRGSGQQQPASGREPVIDLADPAPSASTKGQPKPKAQSGTQAPWVFVDGKWAPAPKSAGGSDAGMSLPGEGRKTSEIVTQRVIKIPRDRLEAGDSTYNIIIRPGDVVRIPEAVQGVFYVGGNIRRAGSFNIPPDGRMTIRRAIDAAGGLDALAWPERAELTRALGEGRQAIVSFNLRAIYEGTQPDIYVKPDDQINIGSSFWAQPLAVLRNAFRASYGFGFLLDRNFGADVFGLPPEYKTRARSPFPF
jgi:protein involved in polysaccharide export with SLBB domain